MESHTPRIKRVIATIATLAMLAALSLGSAAPAFAAATDPLAGSTFEGGDGNLTVGVTGHTDWANVAGLNTGIDKPSGSTDDSFGQGPKEDDPSPTIVTGSIPPNKNDLTRFYEASEFSTTNNNIFLYLAWQRAVNIGAADIDFEINQAYCDPAHPTAETCSGNNVTPVRTAGDLLILYEFSGSGTPTIEISKWVTTGAASQCESSNTVPCWGKLATLDATESQAAVNAGTVTDPLNGNASLTAGLFGEAAINLTAAGVFQPNVCEAFGSAFTKARTSGTSFTSSLKDFIAPIQVNISNCGTIKVIKHTAPTRGLDQGFSYTTTVPSSATFSIPLSSGSFTLNDKGNLTGDSLANTETITNVPLGNYTVTEGADPTNFKFQDLTCSATGTGSSGNQDLSIAKQADITIAPNGVVTCTYVNHAVATPVIATTLSATNISTGTTVHDSATLTGATSDVTGTVTYSVYTDSACTLNKQDAGTKTLNTDGTVPDSNGIKFDTPGTFYWQAVYNGDTYNSSATSACTSETLVVKFNPAIATTLSATSVSIGTTVSDSASLSAASTNPVPTGTVTYSVYTDSACTLNKQDAGTKTLVNGTIPNSNGIQFNSAGTFYWQAVYSGDTYNNGATSACTDETLVVNPNTPAMSTAQKLLPNDSATITGATSSAGGTITFNLFDPFDSTCSGTPAYTSGSITVAGNGTYSTSNTNFYATDVGTWRWQVVYSGDKNNLGTTSACGVEQFTIQNTTPTPTP